MYKQNRKELVIIGLFFTGIIINLMNITPIEATGQNGMDIAREELNFELLTLKMADEAFNEIQYTGGALIKKDLEAIGFKINLNASYDAYSILYNHRPYELIYYSDIRKNHIPIDLWDDCHSQQDIPEGLNFVGIHNDSLDAHLDFMLNSTMDKVQYHVFEQQAILAEEVPYINILQTINNYPIRHGMTGLVHTPTGFFTKLNPLTALNFHNATPLPPNRNGTEWVLRMYPFALKFIPEAMLPYQTKSYRPWYISSLLWETLVIISETGQIIPWLAENYSKAADGMTYNFTLRENMTWHDQKPITPDDVKFSFDYIKNAEEFLDPAAWSPVYNVTSCTVAPDNTIIFSMDQFRTWGFHDFLDLKIFPKHIFETVPYNHQSWHDLTNMTTKIGSGPYMFEKVEPIINPTTWRFVRNPTYWFQGGSQSLTSLNATVINGGTIPHYPRMDRLTITETTDVISTVTGLLEGEIDTTFYGDFVGLTKAVRDYPNKIDLMSAISQFRKVLMINNRVSPLNDNRVRQAMAYALDYDAIVSVAESGFAIPTYNQYLPEEIYGEWHNSASDIYRYDKLKANQLLDEAGYNDTDNNGIREILQELTTTTTTTTTASAGDGIGFNLIESLVLSFGSILLLTIFLKEHKH